MKAMILSLGALLIVVGTTAALAQPSPATSPTPPASDRAVSSPASPGGSLEMKGGDVDKTDQPASADRTDGGSALPRSAASARTTILGLTPAAASVIAVALLVVVILAILAMTRTGETTDIDPARRM